MAINLEAINRDLVPNFPATPFRASINSAECVSYVTGRDGVQRKVAITQSDIEMLYRDGPLAFIAHLENMMQAAASAGSTPPFCLHCGREY